MVYSCDMKKQVKKKEAFVVPYSIVKSESESCPEYWSG